MTSGSWGSGAIMSFSPPAVTSWKFIMLIPSMVVVRLGTPAAPESCCAP
jgi:hypothetical protein